MGKYRPSYVLRESKPKRWKIHPIWRGIGCILLVVFPIIAFAGSSILVRENFEKRWIAIPADLLRFITVPFLDRVYVADILGAVVLMVIGFALLTIIYAFIYRLVGPPQYGPTDVPPETYRKRRR